MRTDAFNTALLLDRLTVFAPPCLYGFGACVLARKLVPAPAWLSPGLFALLAGAVLFTAILLDWVACRRRWYTAGYAAAWLDLRNRAGGRIIAGSRDAPRTRVVPGVSPLRFFWSLVLPAVFVLAAAIVPAPAASESLSGAGVEREAGRIEQELEDAWEAGALPQPDAEELRRQLESMREMAAGDPQAAAEALASLADKLEQARTARMELLADALEKAASAKAELDESGGSEPSSGSGSDEVAERMEEFRQAMEKMARNEGGADRLPSEMAEMLGGKPGSAMAGVSGASPGEGATGISGIDGQRLDRILDALQNYSSELVSRDSDAQGAAGQSAGRQGALARIGAASEELQNMAGNTVGDASFGTGAVGKGPGESPLVFGDESAGHGLAIEYRPLPTGGGGDDGVTLRRDRMLPAETLPPEEFRQPGRSAVDAPATVRAGQGGAGVGPARQRAVENYFHNLSPAAR